MSRLIILAVTACMVAELASGRVLVDLPKRDIPSLDDLLQQSDPHENDIFSESVSRHVPVTPRGPPRPSPTQHLLENLSRPKYVDASEFRRLEVLPPALDINRQLTLLSASKRIRPPVHFVRPAPVLEEETSDPTYFPNATPLFREDFPVQEHGDEQDNREDTSIVAENIETVDEVVDEPIISTSVSVSTSVSYSNESTSTLDSETSSNIQATDASDTASSSTTTQTPKSSSTTAQSSSTTAASSVSTTSSPSEDSQSTMVSDTPDAPRSSAQVAEAEIVLHAEEPEYVERSGKQLVYEFEPSYPDYPDYSDYGALSSPLSPLAHILGGFGSEFNSYGGGFGRSEFVSSFRPEGF